MIDIEYIVTHPRFKEWEMPEMHAYSGAELDALLRQLHHQYFLPLQEVTIALRLSHPGPKYGLPGEK